MGIAEDLKRAAELLGSEGRMQDNENLDHLYGSVGALFDCTHSVSLMRLLYFFQCLGDLSLDTSEVFAS